METIEIPRFLLDYFDSNVIRTPLSSIQGYADVMLQGAVGPLTEDQRRFLEIIRRNAAQLNQHFGIVLHSQHYIVWDEQAIPVQYPVRDLIEDFKKSLLRFSELQVVAQIPNDALPVWIDKRHARNAFASIGDFIGHAHDMNKNSEIFVKVLQGDEAVTLQIEFNKKPGLRKNDLAYYASFLYVTQRVMELHGGLFSLKDEADEKLGLVLVFPNMKKPPNPTI